MAPSGNDGKAYTAKALQVDSAGAPHKLVEIERHAAGPQDIIFSVKYCGVCHSDVHSAHDDVSEGNTKYPIVLGHEAVGVVEYVGPEVTNFKVGDHAGVGCIVDSCMNCKLCERGEEQYCTGGFTLVFGSDNKKHGRCGPKETRTQGGFSSKMTVHEHFAAKIPKSIPLDKAAPIMCAGITMWDPLTFWKAGSDRVKRVGIAGGGGLGQTGIRIAKAMGCEVTAITTSPGKADALRAAGATHIVISSDEDSMKERAKSLDLILNTISANHDAMQYQKLLATDGTLVQLGLVSQPHTVPQLALMNNRNAVAGSMIGGMAALQELCQFADKHNEIFLETRVVPCSDVDKVMAELKGHAPGITRYVLDVAGTLDDFEKTK